MGTLRIRIGGGGPVVVEGMGRDWRLIVHGQTRVIKRHSGELYAALRELALLDRAVARDAFGVICNCAGAWEDEYTEAHGMDALAFEDWIQRIESGLVHWVDDDGELRTGP